MGAPERKGLIYFYILSERNSTCLTRPVKVSRITPTFVGAEPYTAGQLQSDTEIFDFTDSRFIRPPAINGRNFPTFSLEDEIVLANIVEEVENNEPYLYLPGSKQTSHHQSLPADNQLEKVRKIHLTRKFFLNG